MVVVCRSRLPGVVRKGFPVPAEVLFKRRADTAGVAVNSGDTPSSFSVMWCGGVLRKDQSTPVRSVLSVLRSASVCSGCVEAQSVALVSRAVAYESRSVVSASVSVAFESACKASTFPAYEFRVASASQSTALGSARAESPSSTLPLVLKSLVRRAVAAKVSRRWRRLEDASSSVVHEIGPRSRRPTSKSRALVSRRVPVASVASGVALPEISRYEASYSVLRLSLARGLRISGSPIGSSPRESLRRALLVD
jgi:hypothetical protein